jgi:hypothetical protein
LAWPQVTHELPSGGTFTDNPKLWTELWQGVQVNLEDLERTCGFPCYLQVERLRGYRLIYPDGTLGLAAQKALRALAKTELGL